MTAMRSSLRLPRGAWKSEICVYPFCMVKALLEIDKSWGQDGGTFSKHKRRSMRRVFIPHGPVY